LGDGDAGNLALGDHGKAVAINERKKLAEEAGGGYISAPSLRLTMIN
jgi:hypothetical protein